MAGSGLIEDIRTRSSDSSPQLKPPLYREIAGKIRRMIERGSYRPGERLPSTRELSLQLRAGINTIAHAYALLEDDGIIEARPQSGHYVRSDSRIAASRLAAPDLNSGLTANPVTLGQAQLRVMRSLNDARLVPLGRGAPSPDILPAEKLSVMLANISRRYPEACACYAPPNGLERLRAQIAKRSLRYGCSLLPDEVIITSGCVEAVTLALHAICGPGDTVAVESPVYYTFLNSIQWLGLKVLEIPSTPREGINLEVLSFALQHNPVRACLLISNFGNPLGGLMPEGKKRDLVRLLAHQGIPLIEDDVYGDLCYGRSRPPAFKAFDEHGLVVLCSSFSKTVAPGYRIGWIAAGGFQEKVQGLKSLFNIATSTPTQLSLAEFLSSGRYDRHVRALGRTLSIRASRVRDCVLRRFPKGTSVGRPEGGYFLWVRMPERVDAFRLYEQSLQQGISIAPGTLFTAGERFRNCIRLNCSYWSEQIEDAIRTLGRLADAPAVQRD